MNMFRKKFSRKNLFYKFISKKIVRAANVQIGKNTDDVANATKNVTKNTEDVAKVTKIVTKIKKNFMKIIKDRGKIQNMETTFEKGISIYGKENFLLELRGKIHT